MTDHEERERLAAWCDGSDCQNPECKHIYCANFRAAARLLREPVNTRLLLACKAALAWYALDGDGISDPTRQVIKDAIAAESAHSETPLTSVLAYDAGREEQAAEESPT